MAKGHLDDWDDFEKWQKGGYKNDVAPLDDYWGGGKGRSSSLLGGKSSSYGGVYHRCFKTHPALVLPGGQTIYGGSCWEPVVTDADVYIGFDAGMKITERGWPWKKGAEFLFKITDYCAPDKPGDFKKLVAWTRKQLDEGKKIHCGCIGGHGRTGTFLSALVADMGEKDAISYVREKYCKKAVESSAQVSFLVTHFAVKDVEGYKETTAYKANHARAAKGGKTVKVEGKTSGKKGGVVVSAQPIEKFTPMEQPFTLVKPCT